MYFKKSKSEKLTSHSIKYKKNARIYNLLVSELNSPELGITGLDSVQLNVSKSVPIDGFPEFEVSDDSHPDNLRFMGSAIYNTKTDGFPIVNIGNNNGLIVVCLEVTLQSLQNHFPGVKAIRVP